MKLPAVIYCRVSSPRQVKEGHGLDAQESRGKEYSKMKDYDLERVFKDEGVSGGLLDRPGIQELLTFLEERPLYAPQIVVVVDDLSRWARDVIAHFELKKAIHSRNARLECISHKLENTPTGRFIETVIAGYSEMWRGENKIKVIANMKARLERGYWCFDVPPGFRYVKDPAHGKIIIADEPNASIIKEALEGFASGRLFEQTDVMHFLESRSFFHRKQPKRVNLEQVKRLLTRILYAGYIEYPLWGITRRKAHHQGFIDLDTFERIQERLSGKAKAPQRKDLNKDFPLRGFALCASCRESYTASWSTGRNGTYAYYRCQTKGCLMHNKSVKKKDIEDDFATLLTKMKPQPQILALTKAIVLDVWNTEQGGVEQVKEKRQERVKELDESIEKLCERVEKTNSETVISRYEARIEDMEQERLSLEASLNKPKTGGIRFETATDLVFDFINDPSKLWHSDNLYEQRLVPKLVFTERLPYRKGVGYETTTFSLLFALCKEAESDSSRVVEMAGVEPASNVCIRCSYCRVHFRSLLP